MLLNKYISRVCLLVVFVCSMSISVKSEAAIETKTVQLYSLEDFSHLSKMGLSRGHNQDVQSLGIILKSGESITIQQTNPQFRDTLVLRLYADDERKEEEVTIPRGVPFKYVAKQTVVPLIKTPVSKIQPQISVQYDVDTIQLLPTFDFSTKEETFFTQWDQTGAPYAFISWHRINFLIPKASKENLRKMKDFKNITEMMQYYQDAIEYFDTMVGLGTNIPNVEARYLAKANAHGGGYMYYGGAHIAENAPTMNGFFDKGWGPIHEIGHGYQGHFVNQQGIDDMRLGDVWNNIFAHNYQMKTGVKWTWLYGNNYAAFEEKQWANRLANKKYNQMEYDEKLYFFVSLTERFGIELISDFYKNYYKFVKEGGDVKTSTNDLLVKYFSKTANANLAPYFKSYGVPISYDLEQELPGQYPLGNAFHARDVLPPPTIKSRLNDLGLKRTDGVLTSYDLKSAGIDQKGSETLQFDRSETDPSEFEGLVGKLVDPVSNEVVKQASVSGGTAVFTDVPAGSYYVLLPKSNSEVSYPSIQYLSVGNNVVKSGQPVEYFDYGASNVDFLLKGLGDGLFASVKINGKNAVITTLGEAPHVYFTKEEGPYAAVEISNNSGGVKYYREYIGNVSTEKAVEKVPLDAGDRITIRHKEPKARLVPMGVKVIQEFITLKQKTTYVYTPEGLMKEGEDPSNIQKRSEWENNYIQSKYSSQPNFSKDGFYWKYKQ